MHEPKKTLIAYALATAFVALGAISTPAAATHECPGSDLGSLGTVDVERNHLSGPGAAHVYDTSMRAGDTIRILAQRQSSGITLEFYQGFNCERRVASGGSGLTFTASADDSYVLVVRATYSGGTYVIESAKYANVPTLIGSGASVEAGSALLA